MSAAEVATRSGAGPSDAALVVAARAGERWAREALFRRHAHTVNGLALRLMGRDADVDDLVQDSFMQANASLDRLENPQAFASWICSIVVRTAHKLLRRRTLMRRLGLRRPEPLDVEALIAPSAPPDVAAELRVLYRVLETLPAKVRVPLVLHRVEGYALEETAALVGASLTTVKRRIVEGERALERTLSRLQGREGSAP